MNSTRLLKVKNRVNSKLGLLRIKSSRLCLVSSQYYSLPVAAPRPRQRISVAAMTGDTLSPPFSQVADFSSRGPGDFYNPATGVSVAAARPTVDIAAPGDNLTLAFYGGVTGGHVTGSDPTLGDGGAYHGQYYIPGMAGTSFAAPVVAGGAALLVDAGRLFVGAGAASAEMLDPRVIKATLMAGATTNAGWNNGQHASGGVITTEQALAGAPDHDGSRFRVTAILGDEA
jgi:subtilisin family serine protease